LQFIIFLTLSNLNKTSNRAVTNTSYKMLENRRLLLKRLYCFFQVYGLFKKTGGFLWLGPITSTL